MADPIRVLVVDDSALYRETIIRLLGTEPDIQVVGTARNGQEAITQAIRLRPDVITLDVEMPIMNGLTALATIMQQAPSRVIMLSSLTSHGTRETVNALYLGALDFIAKPASREHLSELGEQLILKIRAVMQARLIARRFLSEAWDKPKTAIREEAADRLVVIGASTGGPAALEELLSQIDGSMAAAILVVQHMPKGFTASLAHRLNRVCSLKVEESQAAVTLNRGRIYLARGGTHLVVDSKGMASSVDGPNRHGVKPAVDITLESGVMHYGASTTAVILTGMGRDGTAGSAQVKQAGGRVLAQDEASSIIFGMPRSVIEAGLVKRGRSLSNIAGVLNGLHKEVQMGGDN